MHKSAKLLLMAKSFLIAKKLHVGQKINKKPVIDGIIRVANAVEEKGLDYKYVCAAYLMNAANHISIESLKSESLPEDVLEAVNIMKTIDNQPVTEYLNKVKSNEIARQVKITEFEISGEEKSLELQVLNA